MKSMIIGIFLLASAGMNLADDMKAASRLSKKDKQDLITMFTEFIDGMERTDLPIKEQVEGRWWFWESPMTRIEKSIDQLNEMAQQIHNFIVDSITIQESSDKECCHKILARLEQVEHLLIEVVKELIRQRQVMGNLDDVSVGDEEFNSVEDIDDATLSAIAWLKTIYREQLKDKFIS
jgi:hypothetical protein